MVWPDWLIRDFARRSTWLLCSAQAFALAFGAKADVFRNLFINFCWLILEIRNTDNFGKHHKLVKNVLFITKVTKRLKADSYAIISYI